MEVEITSKINWWQINTLNGIYYEPCDEFSKEEAENLHPELLKVTMVTGYGARYNSPGYLDVTDWDVYDTYEEAEESYY